MLFHNGFRNPAAPAVLDRIDEVLLRIEEGEPTVSYRGRKCSATTRYPHCKHLRTTSVALIHLGGSAEAVETVEGSTPPVEGVLMSV